MNLTEYAIKNRAVSYFFLALLLLGGIGSYFVLGQLEDPVFTVKTGVVVTPYPGASAYEVELEVTDLIEQAIQQFYPHAYLGLAGVDYPSGTAGLLRFICEFMISEFIGKPHPECCG